MRILTIEEARAQNSTPAELRVLANSLERIAKRGYDDFGTIDGVMWFGQPVDQVEPAYDYKACRENAAALRRLAAQLGKK